MEWYYKRLYRSLLRLYNCPYSYREIIDMDKDTYSYLILDIFRDCTNSVKAINIVTELNNYGHREQRCSIPCSSRKQKLKSTYDNYTYVCCGSYTAYAEPVEQTIIWDGEEYQCTIINFFTENYNRYVFAISKQNDLFLLNNPNPCRECSRCSCDRKCGQGESVTYVQHNTIREVHDCKTVSRIAYKAIAIMNESEVFLDGETAVS